MSDSPAGQNLMLQCPACHQPFATALPGPAAKELAIVCGVCRHRLSTDEILHAMAASLNDLVEQTRSRLAGKPPDKA